MSLVIALISWLVFGLIVGLIARAILPGTQRMSLLVTSALGVVGSFIGGTVGNMLTGHNFSHLHAAGWIGSIVGAILILVLTSMVRGNQRLA